MPVIFKGGTSGNRENALPPVPNSGASQPVLRTEFSGREPANVVLNTNHAKHTTHTTGERLEDWIPNDMPIGGKIPEGSSDVAQQDIANLGPRGMTE